MSVLFFMSIIILIILITLIIVCVQLARKATFIKNTNIALTIYIVILFVCTIAYFIMPKSEGNAGSYLGVEQQDAEKNRIISALYAGRIDQVDDFVIDKQSFEFAGEELMLEEAQGDTGWFELVIARKAEDDGIIEVHQLNTGTYLNNVNVTDKLEPMQIDIMENALWVQNTPFTSIDMTFYKKEFPMMQFTSGEDVSGLFSNTDSFGFDLIYLRIPNNVLVKNETPYIVTYVEE